MSANDIAMLAARDAHVNMVRYPILGSIKYDGIRMLVRDDCAMSRANIQLPNVKLQMWVLAHWRVLGALDGEIICGDPAAEDCYNRTQKFVSTRSSLDEFHYYVFDTLEYEHSPFSTRLLMLDEKFRLGLPPECRLVVQSPFYTSTDLKTTYLQRLEEGHEGMILRQPGAPYKRGRGTLRAQDMMKLKPREDSEAEIIEAYELMHNDNPAFIGERGQTKRSSHLENQRPGGTLGGFTVRDLKTGVVFNIGSFKGLTAKDKQHLWDVRSLLPGQVVKYSYCPIGVIDKPRQPTFQGWRESFDR